MKKHIIALSIVLAVMLLYSELAEAQLHRYDNGEWVMRHEFEMGVKQYTPLVKALRYAKRGQVIRIAIVHNRGGYVHTLKYVTDAMQRSRATIRLRLVGYGYSAGAIILTYGHSVWIPKHSRILYHQISGDDGYRDRSTYRSSVAWHREARAFRFMTRSQQRAWHNGRDVIVKGYQMCKMAGAKLVKNQGCYIRGIK